MSDKAIPYVPVEIHSAIKHYPDRPVFIAIMMTDKNGAEIEIQLDPYFAGMLLSIMNGFHQFILDEYGMGNGEYNE